MAALNHGAKYRDDTGNIPKSPHKLADNNSCTKLPEWTLTLKKSME